MVVLRFKHYTLLNLLCNSMTKTWLLIIGGAIFICHMLYGQYRTNYMVSYNIQNTGSD